MCCMFVWLVTSICFGLENSKKRVFCLNNKNVLSMFVFYIVLACVNVLLWFG